MTRSRASRSAAPKSAEARPANAPPRLHRGSRSHPRLEVVRNTDPRAAFYDRMADDLAARVPSVRAEAMRAIFRLVTAYDALHHFVAPKINERGLSMAGFNLLCVLSQEPRGLAVSELSERLLVTRQNVNVVVQGLEKKRLVRRVVDEDDRRIRRISVTEAGATLRDAILPAHLDRVCSVMKNFDTTELTELAGLLARVRSAVH